MPVRRRFYAPRATALGTTLMLAILAGCSQDDSVTGPQPAAPLDGAAELKNLESEPDVGAAAVSHYADGYVYAFNPTSASYNAGGSLAFNRSGRAITITRQGAGTYTVRFAGLSAMLGSKSTVQVTAAFTDNTYCKPVNQKLLSDVVHIKCFDAATGSPSDAHYAVYITKNYGHLAFAFANKPTETDYAPPGSASHNPSGAIRVVRNSVGFYTVKFTGFKSKLTSNGGHAQVVAIGTGAQHCKIGDWGGGGADLSVFILCYTRLGAPKDVKFNVFFATPNPTLAYALALEASTPSYTPNPFYSSNPSGGAVTIQRTGVGQYLVTWSGLALLDGGDVQVTTFGDDNIVCKAVGWSSPGARVRCFNPSTNALVDSSFGIMYFS